MGKVDRDAFVFGDEIDAVVQRRQHAQAKQVELHQTDCRTIIFVPLQHTTVFHACPFDGNHIGQRPIAHDHATGVDAHVPGKILDLLRQMDYLGRNAVHCGGIGQTTPVPHLFTPRILLPLREPQRLGHVAHRHPAAVGDGIGDLSSLVSAMFGVDVLDDFFSAVGFDVDIDIGFTVTRFGHETFEQQAFSHRIDAGDTQRVTDRRVDCGSSSLTQDIVGTTEASDVVNNQKIPWKALPGNDIQLFFYLDVCLLSPGARAVASRSTFDRQLPQKTGLGMSVFHIERRQLRGNEFQIEGAGLPQLGGRRHHLRTVRKQPRHLVPGTQMRPSHRIQPARHIIKALACPHRRHRHGQTPALRCSEMCCRGGDDTDTES
ncbi:Uncharacterised protein [Mycobacteroides abscessus]|nr:Uncharacterised protein [Mycobacteroides abscessus]CQA11529.1 Uncharacterised protein [Mycobacteroides abscessus]